MLGHELRNPLATLTTAAELLRVARDKPEVLDNAQALIARQAAHMTRLVNDLLEVGRVTGGKIHLEKAPVDLGELARRVAASWQSTGRLSRHRFREAFESAWIVADPARIEQIVSNLLDNAVKYTPAGRSISLRVRHAGAQALLEVSDDGQGLAPELTERVFDLFVQGERGLAREQGGLGIGLTLVKRLAELHAGTATASSPGVGRGSTFTVTFPIAEPPAVAASASAASIQPRRHRVLIVDDNADARASLSALLGILGHKVSSAQDGAEAMALFAAERPEAALIDIGLPDISGYELARRIRERDEGRTLLVALTGYGRQQDRDASMKAGFNAHLTQPAGLEELERLFARAPGGSSSGAVVDFSRRRA
jgi:CheY-like chemotaxis protein/anti-sigma regulatory factor (Ser/Thr protein kinase)